MAVTDQKVSKDQRVNDQTLIFHGARVKKEKPEQSFTSAEPTRPLLSRAKKDLKEARERLVNQATLEEVATLEHQDSEESKVTREPKGKWATEENLV
jgi:hypothetical protein